jgi:effector-binding domain-containing protein
MTADGPTRLLPRRILVRLLACRVTQSRWSRQIRAARAGHGTNVCVYRAATREGVELEVGVVLDAGGPLCNSRTPAGRAVRTVHRGPYHELGKASDAVSAYVRERGWTPGATWEVYGHHHDDPAQLETEVFQLIA